MSRLDLANQRTQPNKFLQNHTKSHDRSRGAKERRGVRDRPLGFGQRAVYTRGKGGQGRDGVHRYDHSDGELARNLHRRY